jgi:hypothetical protein
MNITTNGAGDIKDLTVKADSLKVSINDSGNAHLDVGVNDIEIEMNDVGDLSIQGVTKRQNIRSNASRGTLSNSNLAYSE